MQILLKAAFNQKIEELADEEFKISVSLEEIDQTGNVFIAYEPPIVATPNDWNKLWDIAEREKLSLKDRENFEKELIKIMHVQFEQNSEELP